MRMTSLKINGRTVSRLFIDGREVALGSASSGDALCFTAQEPGSTIKITKNGDAPSVNLQTSFDGKSWTPYTVEDVITLENVGDKVYFKAVGSNSALASSPNDYHKFITEYGKFEASGNVNSLLEEDEEIARTMSLENRQFCYAYLFSGTALTTAPELPATTLAYGCYAMMFNGCSSLTQAPILPAEELADFCYYYMFENCTSLTQAPVIRATELASECCYRMFSGCLSLTQAPELPATTLATQCYYEMFSGCTSLNYVSVGFDNWEQYATENWLPENAGTFKCPQTLIDNTTERTTSTVPASWTMTV